MINMITDIQKYSIHDGKGTRTTVFFKGCPLRCRWCHNPETQSFEKEIFYFKERCTGCNACRNICPCNAVDGRDRCQLCEKCVDVCNYDARKVCGREISVDQLEKELMKDEMFYELSGGGVTLSGGEVLASNQEYLVALMSRLHKNGISINIDTCGYVPYSCFESVLPYTDTFLYDIKLVDPELHKEYTGVDNTLILDNLKKLNEDGAKIWIRLPIIGGVNDTEIHMEKVAQLLIDNHIHYERITILPYHNTGSGKNELIGQPVIQDEFYTPDEQRLQQLKEILLGKGLMNVHIR